MRPFRGRRVLLGVTGGIACYKSIFVARELTLAGAEVDVVLTRAAQEFVGRITFEAVTGRPTHTALIDAGHALDHIRLARAADAIVVAPATADFLARAAPAAHGTLVANPPYGIRLADREAVAAMYPRIGDTLKQRYAGWTAWLFSADKALPKLMHLKADSRTPLFNGALECRLYQYRILAGRMVR